MNPVEHYILIDYSGAGEYVIAPRPFAIDISLLVGVIGGIVGTGIGMVILWSRRLALIALHHRRLLASVEQQIREIFGY